MAAREEHVYLVDRATGQITNNWQHDWPSGLAFDPSSTYLACGWGGQGGGFLMIYRIANGELQVLHEELDRSGVEWSYPRGMDLADLMAKSAFSPDGRLVAFYAGSQWGMEANNEAVSAETRPGSPIDFRRLVETGRHGEIFVYEVETGKRRWHVALNPELLQCEPGAFLPDDVSDGVTDYLDILAIFDRPSDILFTPDGHEVVCGSATGEILCLDVADGRLVRRFDTGARGRAGWIRSLALDASGATVWAAAGDRLVRVLLRAESGGNPHVTEASR